MTPAERRVRSASAIAPLAVVTGVAGWADRLDAALDPSRAAGALLGVLASSAGAARASVLLVNPLTGRLRVVAGIGLPREAVHLDLPPAPRRISDWVLRERRGIIMDGELRDERFEASAPHDQIGSAMCVPLPGARGVIGVLNLARVGNAEPFTPDDLTGLESTSAAIAAILERVTELASARRLWRRASERAPLAAWPEGRAANLALSLVPGASPAPDVCEHVARDDGSLVLMLTEPFGATVPAMRTAEWLRGAFHALATSAAGLGWIAGSLDAGLRARRPGEAARAWFGSLTPSGNLKSCAMGYPAPFCLPSEGTPGQRLLEGGPPLGTGHAGVVYEETALRMLPGDALVVVSDGVLNACSPTGRTWDEAGVIDHLLDHARRPLEPLVEGLTEAARAHTGLAVPTDDLLALALRYTRAH